MKKVKIIKKVALILPIVLVLLTNVASAHSGRTDSRGGHKDNKNASGLGSYHYHCGGHPAHLHTNGICPYSSNNYNNSTSSSKSSKSSNTSTSNTVKEEDQTIEVTDISINQGYSTTLEIGQKATLSAIITPSDATNKTITWKSSNSEVLTINESGQVEAISSGTVQIIATSNNGKTSEVSVTVKPKPILVEQIILSKTDIKLTEGDSVEIIATVLPDNASNKSLKWESSNSKVATVVDGRVKSKGEGTTIITVLSEDNIEAQCKITVEAKESNPAGAVGAVGGLSVLGTIGAIIKSRIKK